MKFKKLIDGNKYKLSYKDVFVTFPAYSFWIRTKDNYLLTTGDDFELIYNKSKHNFIPSDNNMLFDDLIIHCSNYFDNDKKRYLKKYIRFMRIVAKPVY